MEKILKLAQKFKALPSQGVGRKKKYGPKDIKYDPIRKPYKWSEPHWTERIPAWAVWLGLGLASILMMTFAIIGMVTTWRYLFG